jgi:hypothetical protein
LSFAGCLAVSLFFLACAVWLRSCPFFVVLRAVLAASLAGCVAVLGCGAAVRRAGSLAVLLGFAVVPRAVLSWLDVFLWFVLVLGWLAVVLCFAAVLQAVPGRLCNAQKDDEKMPTRWV